MTATLHHRTSSTERATTAYVTALLTAVIVAGAPGHPVRSQHPASSTAAHSGPHTAHPYVGLRVAGHTVHVHCAPTSQGVVLVAQADTGPVLCLPTYDMSAAVLGAAVIHLARRTTQAPAPIDRACDGCTAEAGQPCTWACLSHTTDQD